MDALLIRPNDSKAVYSGVTANAACEPPFWAATIAAYTIERGCNVEILDAEALNLSPEDVRKIVKEKMPSLVILVVTGTNLSASTWKMNGAQLCAKIIKEGVDIPIMMWGLHPSALPETTLEDANIDFVMKGEGLDSIYKFIKDIGNKAIYEEIDGLYYRDENGNVHGNNRLNLISAEAFPEPAWDLLPMQLYKAHNWQRFGEKQGGGYAVIATSLGCPFTCSFCAVSTLFGDRHVRFLKPEKVVEMIDTLVKKYDVKYIKLLDENFVLNINHVESICDLLIERNYDLNIWAYARVDTVNEKILKKLKKAGIQWLAYGIESASELSLADVSKGQYSVQKIHDVMAMTKAAGINIMANFMFGLPEDTKESMEETLNLARELNPEYINFYCTMAYPGSNLYLSTQKEHPEHLPENWLGYSQFSYECLPLPTNYISAKEVLRFRDYAFNAFFDDNERYFNHIRAKFGEATVEDIKKMLTKKLKRRLLEEKNEKA